MHLVLIGGLILAADYSQLELRILAHLSRDRRLLQVLNSGEDVFKSIAAEWKMVDLEAVDDCMRQQAKQVGVLLCPWQVRGEIPITQLLFINDLIQR